MGAGEPAPPTLFAAEAELHEDELLAFTEDVAARGGHLGELLHEVWLGGGGQLLRGGWQWLGGGRGHDGGAGAARGRGGGGGGRSGLHGAGAGAGRLRLSGGRARVTSARAHDRARRRCAHRASRPRLLHHTNITLPFTLYSTLLKQERDER